MHGLSLKNSLGGNRSLNTSNIDAKPVLRTSVTAQHLQSSQQSLFTGPNKSDLPNS